MALRESGMVDNFECSQRVNVLMDQLLDKHLSDYAVNWNKMQPKENQSKPASNLKNNCQNDALFNYYALLPVLLLTSLASCIYVRQGGGGQEFGEVRSSLT